MDKKDNYLLCVYVTNSQAITPQHTTAHPPPLPPYSVQYLAAAIQTHIKRELLLHTGTHAFDMASPIAFLNEEARAAWIEQTRNINDMWRQRHRERLDALHQGEERRTSNELAERRRDPRGYDVTYEPFTIQGLREMMRVLVSGDPMMVSMGRDAYFGEMMEACRWGRTVGADGVARHPCPLFLQPPTTAEIVGALLCIRPVEGDYQDIGSVAALCPEVDFSGLLSNTLQSMDLFLTDWHNYNSKPNVLDNGYEGADDSPGYQDMLSLRWHTQLGMIQQGNSGCVQLLLMSAPHLSHVGTLIKLGLLHAEAVAIFIRKSWLQQQDWVLVQVMTTMAHKSRVITQIGADSAWLLVVKDSYSVGRRWPAGCTARHHLTDNMHKHYVPPNARGWVFTTWDQCTGTYPGMENCPESVDQWEPMSLAAFLS